MRCTKIVSLHQLDKEYAALSEKYYNLKWSIELSGEEYIIVLYDSYIGEMLVCSSCFDREEVAVFCSRHDNDSSLIYGLGATDPEFAERTKAFIKNPVRYWRIKSNITQQELAKRSGLPLRTIQKYESGELKIEQMSLQNAVNLSKALKCNLDEFRKYVDSLTE